MKRKATGNFELEPNNNKKISSSNTSLADMKKLFELIKANNVEGVKLITDNNNFNFDVVNDESYLLIHIAAQNGAVGVLRYLIEKQGPEALAFTTQDQFKLTPLMIAASNGHAEVVKVLLEHGAAQETYQEQETPLMIAASNGHAEVAKVLLEYGADMETYIEEETPLMIAAAEGHTEVVKVLLEHGADMEARTQDQPCTTPLMIAASNGRAEVAKVLLEHGADMEARTQDLARETPLMIASREGHVEVVKALLEHGAEIPIKWPNLQKPEISDLIFSTEAVRNICELKHIAPEPSKPSGESDNFAIRIFKNTLVKKGLPCNSYDEFKDKLTKLYTSKIPNNLLETLIKEVDSYKESALAEIKVIEGVLFSYLHDISPIPYSETLEDKERGFNSSQATLEGLREHRMYKEFWDNPDNAKYKTPGTKLIELTAATGTTHLIVLTDLILRALVMTEDDSISDSKTNILEPVNQGVLTLNQTMVLGKNLKQALQKVIDEYNKYKDSSVIKILIAHDNEIEIQKEKIAVFEKVQKTQDYKIDEQAKKIVKLESFIDNINKHLGIEFSVSNDNPDVDIHDIHMDISGNHDSTVYHGEFSS